MIALYFAAALATGGYCGAPADTSAVQAAFLKQHAKSAHPVRLSSIMAIAVFEPGDYAQVTYTGAGMAAEYFVQKGGRWRSVGSQPPSSFPKAAVSYFDRMQNLRAGGGKQCANPKFVPVGSG